MVRVGYDVKTVLGPFTKLDIAILLAVVGVLLAILYPVREPLTYALTSRSVAFESAHDEPVHIVRSARWGPQ